MGAEQHIQIYFEDIRNTALTSFYEILFTNQRMRNEFG